MIAADCLCPLLAGAFGPGAWWAARPAVVAGLGLGVVLPLSLPRTLGAISGGAAGLGRRGWQGGASASCLAPVLRLPARASCSCESSL